MRFEFRTLIRWDGRRTQLLNLERGYHEDASRPDEIHDDVMQVTAQVFSNLRGHMQIYPVFFVHDSNSSTIGDSSIVSSILSLCGWCGTFGGGQALLEALVGQQRPDARRSSSRTLHLPATVPACRVD